MSLAEIAHAGDRLETLESLRDNLAADLDDCKSLRDKAALSKRLMDVLVQIENLRRQPVKGQRTGLTEFERRLKERDTHAIAEDNEEQETSHG